MEVDNTVSEHYQHGDLLQAIGTALGQLGKSPADVTVQDLAPVDEFHVGGRAATEHLLKPLHLDGSHHLLDVGCGLGGAARYVAETYRSSVTGVDLTEEYISTGQALCEWVGLDQQISLQQGNALALPFEDESFDGAYMLHVGMNIADKAQLFTEISRVLRPGASFALYDIMRMEAGELTYPVPWASDQSISQLATLQQYIEALLRAGFEILIENNRRDFSLQFFDKLRARAVAGNPPSPLGLHTVMKESAPVKIKNMVGGITANFIAPVELIARKS